MNKLKLEKFIKENCPKVKFKTKNFGGKEDGTIVKLYKVAEEDERALLYAPASAPKRQCGCFIIAIKYFDSENYINYEGVNANWINCVSNTIKS